MIYLDNAATTYPKPENVLQTLDFANRNAFNAGRGSYKNAKKSQAIIDNVRKKLLELNNFRDGKTIFTTSATQALNNIIFGLDLKEGDNVYVSPFEHNSIIRPLYELQKQKGINIITLPFDKNTWEPDLVKINNLFAISNPKAIFLSQISNVTGYILPYNDIFEISKKYKTINILDASQGYGIINIKNNANINYIIFAGHKSLYASFGVAGYIKLKNDKLKKMYFGGTGSDTLNPNMEDDFPNGYEAGSKNIVAISGLNSSIDWITKTNIFEHEKNITDYLIEELAKIPKVKMFLPNETNNIFGIVSIAVSGYSSEDVGNILDDEYDIAVRTGYHCSPLIHDFIESKEYGGTIRISISFFTTKEDINYLIKALKTL